MSSEKRSQVIPGKANDSKPIGESWVKRDSHKGYTPTQQVDVSRPPRGGSGVPSKKK